MKLDTQDWTQAKAFATRLANAFVELGVEVVPTVNIRREENKNVTIEVRHRKVKSYFGSKEGEKIATVTVREKESTGGFYHNRRHARLDVELNPPWDKRSGHVMPTRRQFKLLTEDNFTKTVQLVAECKAAIEIRHDSIKAQDKLERANEAWTKSTAESFAARVPGMVAEPYYNGKWTLKKGDIQIHVGARCESLCDIEHTCISIEAMDRNKLTFDTFADIYKIASRLEQIKYGA